MQNYGTPETRSLGMSEREIGRYSFAKVIRALAWPMDQKVVEAAGFEAEVSRAAKTTTGSVRQGYTVPEEVLSRRDLTVGTATAGGYLKGTDERGDLFIDRLNNRLLCLRMGATEYRGLVGDLSIPALATGHAVHWVGEGVPPTVSGATFRQISLSLMTVGGFSDITGKLLKQANPAIDQVVMNDLAVVLATEIDRAALHGTGADDQPLGIINTPGIGSVVGGTDGLAPSLSHLIALESAVAGANADVGSLGYLTNAKVRGKLRQTFYNSTGGDRPLWETTQPTMDGLGILNSHRAGATNQVSSTLTKGNSTGVCSAIFFGNWSDLIVASWGGLDILADPYSLSTQGALRVVAFRSVDIAVRNPASFAVMKDVLTT